MDLAKCFDHMDLDALEKICKHFNFHAGVVAVRIYGQLIRSMFVDMQPSDVVLAGPNIRGKPQGCPISCTLCNLYSMAWHLQCARACPGAKTFSVLDDRLAVCSSWNEVAKIIEVSGALDQCFGPALNFRKTVRGVAFAKDMHRPAGPDGSLQTSGIFNIREVNMQGI